jgi:LytR cell envelope-related transcriptional attenuator
MLLGLSSPRFGSHPSTSQPRKQSRTQPGTRPGTGRDQRGVMMSTPLALVSAGAVLLSGVAYFATSPSAPRQVNLTFVKQETEPHTTLQIDPTVDERARAHTYVVVFNNSSVSGLAGRTATKLSDAGWNVVGSDNWFGTIPATTVYYPPQLKAQANLLAADLGIDRARPAIDPMARDRLTVILTSDFG